MKFMRYSLSPNYMLCYQACWIILLLANMSQAIILHLYALIYPALYKTSKVTQKNLPLS